MSFYFSKVQKQIGRYKLLSICFVMLFSVMLTSCQNDVDSVVVRKVNPKKQTTSDVNKISSSCGISMDSIGIYHNIILERYRTIFNQHVKSNNIVVKNRSETFNDDLFTTAALQVAIERCPSSDTSALRLVLENFDTQITSKKRLERFINNSSTELGGYINQLTQINTLSEVQSISSSVQSSQTISLKEKQSFFVLSSVAENSFLYWDANPVFGNEMLPKPNVPDWMMIDAAAASQYWNDRGHTEGFWGGLNAAAHGASASARAH